MACSLRANALAASLIVWSFIGQSATAQDPCATSHKPVFYLNDFSYLSDPDYQGDCLGDSLKGLGSEGRLDFGGQMRNRYHHEVGMGQQAGVDRFQDTTNDFLLSRYRLYANYRVTDNIRLYGEGIYAGIGLDNNDYVARGIDNNWGDFLNLFADLKLVEGTSVRVGRQELLYGNERLVSPLDWGNTRRTFEGVKVMHQWDDVTIDYFYTNLVAVNKGELDKADYDQSLYGVYSTWKMDQDLLDVYYLGYDDESPAAAFSIHTFGARLLGSTSEGWLYEMEGGGQVGKQSLLGLRHESAFATFGVGRKLGGPWNPTLWGFWDYASGNNVGGDFNRFNDLFPLGHKYLGFIDAVRRQNVESPNVLYTVSPTKKLTLLAWYYHFMANQDTDIVPSLGGTPAQKPGSKDLGDELDLLATYNVSARTSVLVGYSHFWRGNKIIGTNGADFVYLQMQTNF